MTVIPADIALSRERKAREDRLWQEYAEACFNPLASEEQRRELIDRALDAMDARLEITERA